MKAMVLRRIRRLDQDPHPLESVDWPTPRPDAQEIMIKVATCGVCHTELDEIEGRTPPPKLPVVPGHQVVGRVESMGAHCRRFKSGDRVGVAWTGDTGNPPPEQLDALIDTTPAWRPVLAGLKNLKPGGRLVINAIRKEGKDKSLLLHLDYPSHLWLEKEIKSVANVTRKDVNDFLRVAAEIPLIPEVQEFDLLDANQALMELKTRKIRGAKVLRIRP